MSLSICNVTVDVKNQFNIYFGSDLHFLSYPLMELKINSLRSFVNRIKSMIELE